jgi:glycosyltransferase involved in cell wall biosynthesis
VEGIKYLFLHTPGYQGNGAKRVINMMVFLKELYLRGRALARTFRPEVVIASSTYPADIWPAHRIARHAGAKLVYEVHDLWPLSPMELGGYSPRHPFMAWLQRAENFAYRHCDLAASLLPNTLDHMVQHGLDPGKFVYVPNGIVSSDWDITLPIPEHIESLLGDLRSKGHAVVGYTGALGVSNAMNPFMEAMALVSDLPVSFVIVGSGPEKEALQTRAVKAGLTNTYFFGNIPRNTVPALLHRMDFLYVGFQRQALYRFGVSPNKLYDYMMSGKPIIQGIEAGNNPVRDAGCGLAIEPDNPEAIARAIRTLLSLPHEEHERMGAAGKRYVIANHDYPILAKRFLDAL